MYLGRFEDTKKGQRGTSQGFTDEQVQKKVKIVRGLQGGRRKIDGLQLYNRKTVKTLCGGRGSALAVDVCIWLSMVRREMPNIRLSAFAPLSAECN